MTKKPFIVLSWGAGVQSTALAEMSISGDYDLPRLNAIIHSNTQWERTATYQTVKFYSTRWREMGAMAHQANKKSVTIEIVTAGDIRELGATKHIHMPFWTENGGPLRRECSFMFKITPIKRAARRLAGFHETRPPHPRKASIEQWVGFSWDEWYRVKRHKRTPQYIAMRWPLVELKLTRRDCEDYLTAKGLPVPIKSSCIGCPYRRASEWLEMKERNPDEFAQAVAFDDANRHNPLGAQHGRRIPGSTAAALYIYNNAGGRKSSRVRPLSAADLAADAAREQTGKQIPLLICNDADCWT